MTGDESKIVLETERLILRPLVLNDLEALATIEADPEVMRYYPSGPRSREQTLVALERCMTLQAEHGYSLWAAVDRASSDLVGRCGLLPQTLQGQPEVEIAYMIGRPHWNQGLATEAALAIRDIGFDGFQLTRLVSIIHRDNQASRRVAEKVGLRPERMIQFMNHRCWLYAIDAKNRGTT